MRDLSVQADWLWQERQWRLGRIPLEEEVFGVLVQCLAMCLQGMYGQCQCLVSDLACEFPGCL